MAGEFSARKTVLTSGDLAGHLAGRHAVHAYCLTPISGGPAATCLWAAFDIDAKPGARRKDLIRTARLLSDALAGAWPGGRPVVEATGGDGLHIWALLAEPAPAEDAAYLMDTALTNVGLTPTAQQPAGPPGVIIERYPKTPECHGLTGSALRVPLGVHPRTGSRSVLVDPTTGHIVADPIGCLAASRGPAPPAAPPAPAPVVSTRRPATRTSPVFGEPPRPDAWATYEWAVSRLSLVGRTHRAPSPHAPRASVRCLWPERHTHEDRTGQGSAWLVRDNNTQLIGCSACGVTHDTLAVIRLVEPGLTFMQVRELAHAIDPVNCPPPTGQ